MHMYGIALQVTSVEVKCFLHFRPILDSSLVSTGTEE